MRYAHFEFTSFELLIQNSKFKIATASRNNSKFKIQNSKLKIQNCDCKSQ